MPSHLCCCSSVQTPKILLLSSEAWLDPCDSVSRHITAMSLVIHKYIMKLDHHHGSLV